MKLKEKLGSLFNEGEEKEWLLIGVYIVSILSCLASLFLVQGICYFLGFELDENLLLSIPMLLVMGIVFLIGLSIFVSFVIYRKAKKEEKKKCCKSLIKKSISMTILLSEIGILGMVIFYNELAKALLLLGLSISAFIYEFKMIYKLLLFPNDNTFLDKIIHILSLMICGMIIVFMGLYFRFENLEILFEISKFLAFGYAGLAIFSFLSVLSLWKKDRRGRRERSF